MKKLLLLLTAVVLSSATAFAQSRLGVIPFTGVLDSHPAATPQSKQAKAPRQKALGENQLILGGYTSDALSTGQNGLGLTRYPGTLSVASELLVEDFLTFDGGKVVKIRVGLANAVAVSRVFITPVSKTGSILDDIVSQEVNWNSEGWNEVELTTPVTLQLSDYAELLIGFDYVQTSTQTLGSYPLSLVTEGDTYYNTLVYGNLGNGTGWYNIGVNSYGNLSVQCFVESDRFTEKDIVVGGVQTDARFYQPGDSLSYQLALSNQSTSTVQQTVFDVWLDDLKAGTLTTSEELKPQANIAVVGKLKLPEELAQGSHKLSVKLAQVDGDAPVGNLDNDEAEVQFVVYTQSVARQKNLVEQYTSQYCTYCPRGVAFFEDLTQQRSDVVWVSHHGNMSSGNDIFNNAYADSVMYYMNVTGYPSGSFNRTYVSDLAEASGELAYGLGYNMSYRAQVVSMFSEIIDYTAQAPSFATIDLSLAYDNSTRELQVTVSGEGVDNAQQLLANFGLTVFVTENGLTARQLNEGVWENNFTHHYVLRTALTKTTGNAISWQADGTYKAVFSYTVPAEYVAENLQVVAFVAPQVNFASPDYLNLAVNNCEAANVKDAISAAIAGISVDDNVPTARYSLDGRRLTGAQKGLNLVRMADGTTRKVVVR